MKFFLYSSLIFIVFFSVNVDADASISFGSATIQSPAVSLKAVNDNGRLVQTVTWTFQASQCEVLTRTDESITSRAVLVSLTSTCINRNVCGIRGTTSTPIVCEEFMRRLT
ncbi:hypothetical protein B9Z55_000982 [Caenorhabditis nigoni]|nr:hypothetical protein B9Z55_000982 [Caenorhabditis nigoni]